MLHSFLDYSFRWRKGATIRLIIIDFTLYANAVSLDGLQMQDGANIFSRK